MLRAKKKISKKEIKEDKLVTNYYKAISFYEKNQKNILYAAGGLIVVVLLIFFYRENAISNNEEAGIKLAKIMNVYDSGNYLEAIEGNPNANLDGLKKIVDDFGSTENGETAKVLLAKAYYYMDKKEDALKYFSDYGGSNPLLKAAALAGEAACYEDKGDYEKAAALFQKAAYISSENVMNPNYLMNAGINYIHIGKNSTAKEIFEKIKKDFSNSTYARDIDKYLSQVN